MTSLRSRILGAILFGLLSLGQAYPFSVAWASAGKTACCCAMKVEKCGCKHGHGAVKKKMSCHEDRTAGFAPSPCGSQPNEERTLSFKSDPFLPQYNTVRPLTAVSFALIEPFKEIFGFTPLPEPPPPRA